MRMLWICLSILISIRAFPQSFELPDHANDGGIAANIQLDYFSTDSNYDTDGNKFDVPTGNSFDHYLVKFEGHYHLPGGWSIGGGARLALAESVGLIEDRSTTELTDLYGIGRLNWRFQNFRFTPQAVVVLTLEPVEPGADKAIASEGTNEFAIGSWLEYPVWMIQPYAFLGYRYRDDGRSALLDWRVGTRVPFGKWWLGGDLRGYRSVSDDEYSDSPAVRLIQAAAVNGGSFRYYSVDPDLTEAAIYGGLRILSQFDLEAGFKMTLAGKNTAVGNTIYLGVGMAFGEMRENSKSRTRRGKKVRKKSEKFEPDLENYDEEIFKD